MKLIVDIPKDVYARLFDNGIQDNEIAVDDICEMARSLRHGTPIPDNATNGDTIISLYPNLKYTIQNNRVVTTIGLASSFDLDWWNAPYQKGGKE